MLPFLLGLGHLINCSAASKIVRGKSERACHEDRSLVRPGKIDLI
jgi:hypothetical protein